MMLILGDAFSVKVLNIIPALPATKCELKGCDKICRVKLIEKFMGYGVVILVHIINKEKAHYNNIKRASTLCAGPLENKSLKHTHDTILS